MAQIRDVPQMIIDGPPDGPPDAPPDAPNWAFKRQLTIDNTGLGALVDFPVLVVLNGTRIRYSATGADLRFTDNSATQLPYEIESWNPAGTSYVWVKIPAIAAGTTTTFWMFYDNPAAADAQMPTAVWDANFIGVWHLVDAHDSTGINTSTNSGATATAGKIGGAMHFDGAMGHYIDTGSNANITRWTIETWGNPTNAAVLGSNATAFVSRFPDYMMLWDCYQAGYCHTLLYGDSGLTTTPAVSYSATPGQWTHIAGSYDGANLRTIVNGNSISQTAATATPGGAAYTAKIGARENLAYPAILGSIDEVRISNIARSQSWIIATYKTGNDQYITFGAEQPNP